MNRLLFDRSTGSLRPNAFARLRSTQLIHDLQIAPNFRFNGGDSYKDESGTLGTQAEIGDAKLNVFAHQAGVNTLVVDRFEGRL